MILYEYNYHTDIDCGRTDDIDVFAASNDFKVAVFQHYYDITRLSEAKRILKRLIECADHVIIYSVEIDTTALIFLQMYDLPHVTFVVCGCLNFELKYANYVQNTYWLRSSSYMYTDIDTFDTHQKPYAFEAMYGMKKPHRCFVHDRITANANDSVFQTPFLEKASVYSDTVRRDEFWEDDIEIIPGNPHHVRYKGNLMLPSQVLPRKIYDQAAYSIVCETSYDNRWSFFSEKIAKPLVAGRLFIVFSGQHYLRNLRKLGFKTFDTIIDESYDEYESDARRWNLALAEVYKLIERDQTEVLAQCYDIFKHNNEVIKTYTYDWHEVDKVIEFIRQSYEQG